MFSEERRKQIVKIMEEEGRILPKDIAVRLDVSLDSIQQDLVILENNGLLKQMNDGAIQKLNDQNDGTGNNYQKAIAEAAVALIEEGLTVFIGGSSIHHVMLAYLPKDIRFTVVTNSIEVAYKLREFDHIHVYVIGGKVNSSGNITDTLANEFTQSFIIDLAFATAEGISSKGLSAATPDVAISHKVIYDQSKKIVALMEHSTFGIDMFAGMYPIQYLDRIITDEETKEEDVDQMKSLGAKVMIAHNN